MRVIEVDGHVEESVQTFQYLESEYWPRRPIPVVMPPDTHLGEWNGFWMINTRARDFGGTPTAMIMAGKKGISAGSPELNDVPAGLRDLDEAGVERQVLIPSLFMGPVAEDPALEAALMRSCNIFMATQCNQSGGRLFHAAVVPFRSPNQAVAEARQVAVMGSCVSVFTRGLEWDKRVDNPSHLPIFPSSRTRWFGQAAAHRPRLADGLTPLPRPGSTEIRLPAPALDRRATVDRSFARPVRLQSHHGRRPHLRLPQAEVGPLRTGLGVDGPGDDQTAAHGPPQPIRATRLLAAVRGAAQLGDR
jgi:hypothetical protein